MKVKDLETTINRALPIWVNMGGFSDRYDDYDDMIENSIAVDEDDIIYLTINGAGELVIEI